MIKILLTVLLWEKSKVNSYNDTAARLHAGLFLARQTQLVQKVQETNVASVAKKLM